MPEWELMADVDFDSFQMPSLPILQMTKPSTFIKVKEKERSSIFETITEPLCKFFMKCCGGASKENSLEIENDYLKLAKLKSFFRNASKAEKEAFKRHIRPQSTVYSQDQED